MAEHVEREVAWAREKKAPKLKFDDFDFEFLIVRVTGDAEYTLRIPVEDVRRIAREYSDPRHFVFKVAPILRVHFGVEDSNEKTVA